MLLTVLGCYGPYPPAGGACSGYLIEEDGFHILLDCGNGVLSRLQHYLPFWELDGVIVSHLHSDHISDLMIMRYGLIFAQGRNFRREPLSLYAPPDPAGEYARLIYKEAYNLQPLHESQILNLGPFTVRFAKTVHSMPCFAVRLESSRGVLVYSGDTEFYQGLSDFAVEADIFICEANLQNEDMGSNPGNHLSAYQAAVLAKGAGVKRLLLTHHHAEKDIKVGLAEAGEVYPAAEAAVEGGRYPVGEDSLT